MCCRDVDMFTRSVDGCSSERWGKVRDLVFVIVEKQIGTMQVEIPDASQFD